MYIHKMAKCSPMTLLFRIFVTHVCTLTSYFKRSDKNQFKQNPTYCIVNILYKYVVNIDDVFRSLKFVYFENSL